MGFLLQIMLALCSLVVSESIDESTTQLPWAVFAIAPLPYAVTWLRKRASRAGAYKRAKFVARVEALVPVLMQFVAVAFFGWMRSLEEWFTADLSVLTWPSPIVLLALAPFVVYTAIAIDAQARGVASSNVEVRRSMRSFQLRMFLAGLGPIFGYILVAAFLGRWEYLRIGVEEVRLFGIAFTAVLAVSAIQFLPFFLRWTWETERLTSGPQLELLERVAGLAKFRCEELLVWKTGNMMANAAIVGLFPSSRRVFFTDVLLRQMSPRQLAAVYAHEIGHAKRFHVPILLVWALAFFGGLDGLLSWAEFGDQELELLVLLFGMFLWLLGFGWLSRRIELEADLFCLDLLRDAVGISSALLAVAPANPGRSGWRHFSTYKRIDFVERAALDPEVGRGLRRRLRVVATIGLALCLGVGVQQTEAMATDFPAERTVVDLRLGHFAQAAERRATWGPELEGKQLELLAALVSLAESAGLKDSESRIAAVETCSNRASMALKGGFLNEATGW
ncbi:MAG: Zn-dependent protease with chaperone function, partial [Planctomycetota bacterium]